MPKIMRELIFSSEIVPDRTTLIVGSRDIDLNAYALTTPEKEYIMNSFSNKKYDVTINKYGYWYIFVIPEEKNNIHSINEAFRNQAFRIQGFLAKIKISDIQIVDAATDKSHTLAFVEGLCLSNYQFLKYFNNKEDKTSSLQKIELVSSRITPAETEELSNIVKSVYIARDLVNEPASFLTSTQLAREFQKMAAESGFNIEVFDKAKITELGMGGLLAVNKGSVEPPTFSVMTWKPNNAVNTKPYILVGKGLVYDSGGLSLKPTPNSMDYMKCDMAGAAAVAGAMYSIAKNKLPVYVIALAPSTDNRLDANSYSPGDVITMHSGTTVEVLNTDAEGRLVLADALSYSKQFDPELVFTIATLTGAAHRAVGEFAIVGMGNADDSIFKELEETGWQVFERIARFPFWEDYGELIKSDIADLKNIGGDVAGAITAGKFLEHFTKYPFIHLDIAGVAFNKSKTYKGKGGSGAGIRLFYEFLKRKVNTQVS
jgi:leucyl aminopeptidase